MKKILILAVALIGLTQVNAQMFRQSVYSPETYVLTVADTNVFTKADLIASIYIDAIDTVRVKGKVVYLKNDSALVSGFAKINPGTSKGIGIDWDIRMDSLIIINDGAAQYWISRIKR